MKSFYTPPKGKAKSRLALLTFGAALYFLGGLSPLHAQIAQWNFNSNPADANTSTGVTVPNIGAGTASLIGGTTASFSSGDSNNGSTDPSTGDDSGWNVTTYATQGMEDKARGVQFLVSTAGFENIQVRWDQRHSNTAPRHVQLQYTTDGTNWVDFGTPFLGTAGDTWFNNRSADLSSVVAANNNPNFGVRIVASFAPGTNAYAASNTTSNYSTTGTWRFDMVTISGTPQCAPAMGALSNNGPICPGGTATLSFESEFNTGPYTLTVNGVVYNNVANGAAFATLTEGVNFNGTAQFTLTQITDANNCTASGLAIPTTVSVSNVANATITASPNPVAQGGNLSLSVPDAGIGAAYQWAGNGVATVNSNFATAVPTTAGSQTYSVTVTTASNCTATGSQTVSVLPSVSLSVSANTGSENNATAITLTATATAPVSSNQTVAISVSGMGITSGDYYLTRSVITIPSGQTTGTAVFVVADDAIAEPSETAVITLITPSAGIALGGTQSQNIVIEDNTCTFLRWTGGYASPNGAEIPAFDPLSKRLYVVAGTTVDVLLVSNTGTLSPIGTLAPGFAPLSGTNALPNSVAVKNGILAVSYAIQNATTNAQMPGRVSFFNAATGAFLNVVTVGYLPDMATFTPDGTKLLTADEGEPNSYGQPTSFDPEGSVSIVDLSAGVASATVQTVGFGSFNPQLNTLRAAGVRIYGPNATVAQDFEPEYIAIAPNGQTARVTLQENNAIAVLDIANAAFTAIQPLGLKNHQLAGNGLDASDSDGGTISIAPRPVFGMYQPDAIVPLIVGGQEYYLTANEGDSRAYTGYSEEIRVGASGYILDPTVFPNAAALKASSNLGRLQLTRATGDLDSDGDFDRIEALGARSFSIWNTAGVQVYDSGDQFEQITAAKSPTLFNSDGTAVSFDGRSDNKGPEPEGAAIGRINGISYAFIGLERTGDVMVYDVSNPAAPQFVQYANIPQDLGVEGLVFVPAAESPTGNPLLITTAEVSATVSVFEINRPTVSVAVTDNSGVAPNDGTICAGSSATLTAQGGTTYLWNTNATTAAISATAAGTYTVVATNAAGCAATATATIATTPAPTVGISGATSFCAGIGTTLTANASGVNFAWSTGAVTAGVALSVPGTYTVTVTNALQCTNTASQTISLTPLPTVSCPANLTICASAAPIPLAGGAPSGGTYAGNGVSNGMFSPASAGQGLHFVTYSYADNAGCTNACTFSVSVAQPATFIAASSLVPANSTGNTASVENVGGATYAWSITNGTITSGFGTYAIVYTAGASGQVTLAVSVSTANGCSNTGTANVAIGNGPQLTCPNSIVRETSMDGATGDCLFNTTIQHPNTSGANPPITLALAFLNGAPTPNALPTGGAVQAGGTGAYAFATGTTVVRYTATDNNGGTASCAYTVKILDSEAPTLVCPPNMARNTDPGFCAGVATFSAPTGSDNCGQVNVVRISGLPSGSQFPLGINTVVFRATDAAGLTRTCSTRIIVSDRQAPALVCPADQTVNTTGNSCVASVNYANATATDNCSTVSLVKTSGLASGSMFPTGVNQVRWRATDAVGNISTCAHNVTVRDVQVPTLVCPADLLVSTVSCQLTAVFYAAPSVSDNCSAPLAFLSSGLASGSAFPVGQSTVIWKALDNSGNMGTCSFAVMVSCGSAMPAPVGEAEPAAETEEAPIADRTSATRPIQALYFELRPNPAHTDVSVWVDGLDSDATLILYDAQGRLMWQSALPQGESSRTFEVGNFAEGLYWMVLATDKKVTTKRLMVSRH